MRPARHGELTLVRTGTMNFSATCHLAVAITLCAVAIVAPARAGTSPGKLACVGDSITAGESVTSQQCYVGQLRAKAAAAHVQMDVVADGRSGWTTGAFVANAKAVVAAVPADATVVTILLGTNDAHGAGPPEQIGARAAANVEKLVGLYRVRAPRAAFVLVGPPVVEVARLSPRLLKAGFGPPTVPALAAIRDAYRVMAERLGLRYVDLATVPAPAHTVDGVHPDAAGHAEIAAAIWAALNFTPPTGKLVCVGASVTAGTGAPRPELSYVGRLAARAKADGVALEVVRDGRSGWTTGDYLKHADAVLAKTPADATIITFQLGGNDTRLPGTADAIAARAAADMEQLIARYRTRAPRARIVLLSPTAFDVAHESAALKKAGFTDQTPARLRSVTDAYRALAERIGVGFIDLSGVPSPGHTVDGLHPDAIGHAEMADAVWVGLSNVPPATQPATRP
jgi:lysophospholipase L1-like esterase